MTLREILKQASSEYDCFVLINQNEAWNISDLLQQTSIPDEDDPDVSWLNGDAEINGRYIWDCNGDEYYLYNINEIILVDGIATVFDVNNGKHYEFD